MTAPKYTQHFRSGSRLERVLRSGRFAVTAELAPLDTSDPDAVFDRAIVLAEVADAINVTDSSGAHVHMSSLAVCSLLTHSDYEPVFQMQCRDRNRIAQQADLLGAAALGVKNVLCLTGDGVQVGDQPEAKPVFDLDSTMLIRMARIMRDEGMFLSGRIIEKPPRLFLGAAANPFAPPFNWRAHHLAKKAAAGAEFFQTQFCFDVPELRTFMAQARDLGLLETTFFLIGVGPIRSATAAERMVKTIPGVYIPDSLIDRLRKTPKEAQREEGIKICVEIIQQVREIEGVSGVHVMAFRQEEMIAEIIHHAGLFPRRGPRPRPIRPHFQIEPRYEEE